MNATRYDEWDKTNATSRDDGCLSIRPALLGKADFVRDDDRRVVGQARSYLRQLLPDHEALDDIELCLSELVTNSFTHTGSALVTVQVLGIDDLTQVEVRDEGGMGKAPRIPAPTSDLHEQGRGLQMVEALSVGWGTWTGPLGRTTWFQVRTPRAVP